MRINFLHAKGDLNLELYSREGRLIGASRSSADSETISLGGLAAGTYYVRAYGAAGAQNPNYSLRIDPPDDDNEPNDSLTTAKNLGFLSGDQAFVGQQLLDDDWFRFTPITADG